MELFLPADVKFIIDRMSAEGKRADVVGGAVRDACLGRAVSDYDLTTNATPEEIKEIFADFRTIDTGIKHGTVTLHLNGKNYEITTYRRDGEYKDGRHPESVEFTTSLADDLSRRDFTVNAMCYSPDKGFTDLFGGRSDLQARVIRTVGEPERRFAEDALRILRALRFAAVLDFEIEPNTAEAVLSSRELLSAVSEERIWTEWSKLLGGVGAHRIIGKYGDVIKVFIPELESIVLPNEDKFLLADGATRLLAIFAGSHSSPSEAFVRATEKLKTDKKTRIQGAQRLDFLKNEAPTTRKGMLYALSRYGKEVTEGALRLGITMGRYDEHILSILDEIITSRIPYNIGMLEIGGSDIVAMGLRGEAVGSSLGAALVAVIEGKCANERDELLSFVAENNLKA